MKYKGYEAVVSFDADDRVLHGRLLCTQDVVSFEAHDVNELESAFREAVDDYLEQCAASGRGSDAGDGRGSAQLECRNRCRWHMRD